MSNEFKDWYNDLTDEQKQNYKLCIKYPILTPHNRWTGDVRDDYMYEYTELDQMPTGWRIAFGEQWAADVQAVINKMSEEERDKVCIMDIKEKYGLLCQYFNYYTDELDEVINKYTRLSKRTCIHCGAPATKISMGWISPWCDSCAEKIPYKMIDIDEWFKEVEEDGDD